MGQIQKERIPEVLVAYLLLVSYRSLATYDRHNGNQSVDFLLDKCPQLAALTLTLNDCFNILQLDASGYNIGHWGGEGASTYPIHEPPRCFMNCEVVIN